MLRILVLLLLLFTISLVSSSQGMKTELYDLVRSFMYDSTGYENVGSWATDQPKKYKVKWNTPGIQLSDDTAINVFRRGTAEILVRGKEFKINDQPVKWDVLLFGSRMGYSSFLITSPPVTAFSSGLTIDSLFGKKPFRAKTLTACDGKKVAGFYFYELKIRGKDILYLKIYWVLLDTGTAIRVEGYDAWSKPKATLVCP